MALVRLFHHPNHPINSLSHRYSTMSAKRPIRHLSPSIALVLLLPAAGSQAYDINDQFSISGLLAAGGQCIEGSDAVDGTCRGADPFQGELAFKPTSQDELIDKFGFAAGNGLNPVSPFALSTWAADLEDDVKDINGRARSYLLEARYGHTFEFSEGHSLQLTGGIIDSTAFVNGNAFANDEYTQFMNEVFVNAHSASLPSYDLGGALVWTLGELSLTGVGMDVGENDDGRGYNFYAVEAGYHPQTALGAGNYRVMYASTTKDFFDAAGERPERLESWHFSFDQELGAVFGVFLRAGFQGDAALVDYEAEYSGGLNIQGKAWGRESDNIGLGLAYLDGGNDALARSTVVEGYYRFAVNDYLALTADVQYQQDDYRTDEDEDVDGWVLGMRATVEF